MVFLQVEIGQGSEPVDKVQGYVERRLPSPVLGLAPPQGLMLAEVRYPARIMREPDVNKKVDHGRG
jgi:tRNA U38,U39,U40 pseudouridine synthase TruA